MCATASPTASTAINASAVIGGDRNIRVTGNARGSSSPIKFVIKATAPAPPVERQNIPVEINFEAPELSKDPLQAQGRDPAQRHGGDDQRRQRFARRRRVQRLGVGRYFEQAAGQARSRLPAHRYREVHRRCTDGRRLAAVEQRADRPERHELCRHAGQDFRGRDQFRPGPYCPGRDRRRAGQRRDARPSFQSRRLWRPGQWRSDRRCDFGDPDLCDARRSDQCPRAAVDAERVRFRPARRQAAGQDVAAVVGRQPARDHVEPRRLAVRGVPGRRRSAASMSRR